MVKLVFKKEVFQLLAMVEQLLSNQELRVLWDMEARPVKFRLKSKELIVNFLAKKMKSMP
jgi:hypothetical protein